MLTDQIQNPPIRDSLNWIKNVLKPLGWSASPEQEQGVLRLVISIAFLSYLLLIWPEDNADSRVWMTGIVIITGFLIYSLLLLTSALAYPQYAISQRVISICIDIGVFSYGLHVTGPLSAPWFGVYLWVTLGNGFRYGEKYLYLSTAASLTGFAYVAKSTPYWIANTELAIGLTFTLLLIPAYSALLIRRLNEARQRADNASRAKSDFLSCMSHEIRTPLNGILGMTDLLKLRPLEPQDKECVDTIHASGHALARQINDILDLSKIEAGQLTLEQIDFDLYALINTTLRIFQPQAQEKQLQLKELINPDTPFLLSGDPHKLRQIIINLVGNALKFTNQGFISVRIYPRSIDTNQTILRFEVTDTGTGIPTDRLHAIFEPFTQADSSITRSYGGTGLGTTICKNLVELMGGEIGIQSTPDVGTTFWFDIPFQTATNNLHESEQPWTSECKTLYLNPEPEEKNETMSAMKGWNIPFDQVTSLDEAKNMIHSNQEYDALVFDNLPYSEELDLFLSDNCMPPNRKASIIFIKTTWSPTESNSSSREHLFVLQQPLDHSTLYNVLHACYSKHSSEENIIHFAHKQVTEQSVDQSLNILVADDNATNRIVLQRMLEKLGHRHLLVSGGEAALTALENDVFDVVIIDKNMPDMGGLEAFQVYSLAHGGHPPATFIILTADATDESRASCAEAGIEYFLTKPVSLARLQGMLSAIDIPEVELPPDTREETTAACNDPTTLPVLNVVEFNKIITLADGNIVFIHKLINNFETDTRQGLQGLEAAIAARDLTAFRDHAHALKGCALYLGLLQLAQHSLDAENIDLEEFNQSGIAIIQELSRSSDVAIRLLHEKVAGIKQQAKAN
jgi:two-component system sensor histidine kinase RpfC